jgi:hypothetical protein
MISDHLPITAAALEAAWLQIQCKLPQADGRSFLQKALIVGPLTLSAVVRVADGMPGLLLQIPDASYAAKWPVKHYAGVRFDPMVKIDDGYGLPLMLVDLKMRNIFAQLAADIASTSVGHKTADAMLVTILSRLALWRRFLQNRVGKLSDEEIRGLIGELSVLSCLVASSGVDSSLESWKGPLGELHDFRLPNRRIEVKTWCNDSLPRIFISDPSQIVADETCPVWIAAVQISKSETNGLTLPELAGDLARSMDASQRELYYSLLADYGYLDAQSELYADHYSVIETVFYVVTASFPRIDPGAIPPAICAVKYAIELNAIASHAKPSPIN